MEKIKQKVLGIIASEQGRDILTVLIVIMVGIGSFLLGRLSKSSQKPSIEIEYQNYPNQTANQAGNAISGLKQAVTSGSNATQATQGQVSQGAFFASKRGKKYYAVNCSAGKSIVLENRIYFDTREQVENAGYELSSSCR